MCTFPHFPVKWENLGLKNWLLVTLLHVFKYLCLDKFCKQICLLLSGLVSYWLLCYFSRSRANKHQQLLADRVAPVFYFFIFLWGNNFCESNSSWLWLLFCFCFWFGIGLCRLYAIGILSYRLPIWLNNQLLDGRNLDYTHQNLLSKFNGGVTLCRTRKMVDICACKWTLMGNWCSSLGVWDTKTS